MRALPVLVLTLAVALAPMRVAAQTEPGWGFTWEEVGDRPVDADAFTVDARGTLWAASADTVRWLDLANGPPGRWRGVTYFWPGRHPDALLALGADTLIGVGGRTKWTTDGGATWPEVWSEGEYALYEIPPGHPHARRLLVGGGSGGASKPGYSEDRGATWAFATDDIPSTTNRTYAFAAVPPGTAPGAPARVVAGGAGGVWLSDDGGGAWRPSSFYSFPRYDGQQLAALARPPSSGVGVRLVVLVDDTQSGAIRTLHSDDGGGRGRRGRGSWSRRVTGWGGRTRRGWCRWGGRRPWRCWVGVACTEQTTGGRRGTRSRRLLVLTPLPSQARRSSARTDGSTSR